MFAEAACRFPVLVSALDELSAVTIKGQSTPLVRHDEAFRRGDRHFFSTSMISPVTQAVACSVLCFQQILSSRVHPAS